MSDLFQTKFKKTTDTVRMTSAENTRMREILSEYQSFNPIRTGAVQKSPSFFYSISHYHKRAVAVFLILFLILSGGSISYGAERALPGDTLYSLKVNVNEEIWSVLAFSDETRVEWETERAERRLEEATALAVLGNIREEIVTQIAENFETHATRVEDSVKKLALQAPQRAQELRNDFDVVMSAHVMVLRRFGENMVAAVPAPNADDQGSVEPAPRSSGDNTKDSIRLLVTRVEEKGNLAGKGDVRFMKDITKDVGVAGENESDIALQVEQDTEHPVAVTVVTSEHSTSTPLQSDSVYSETRTDVLKVVATRFGKKVEAEIVRMRNVFPNAKGKLTPEEIKQAEAYIKNIDLLYSEATDAFDKKDYERALKVYQKVFPHVIRLRVWLSAGVMFEAPPLDEFAENIKDVVPPKPSVAPIPIPYPVVGKSYQTVKTDAFKLMRIYENGVHKFRGTVTTPTPCHTVVVEYLIAESYPEQITLRISTKNTKEVCIQVIAEKEFAVEIGGVSKEARLVGVFVDGKKIDMELGELGGSVRFESIKEGASNSSVYINGEGSDVNIRQESSTNESSSVNTMISVQVNTGGSVINGADGKDGEDGQDGVDGR
jgi:hypothetical protein